MRNIPRAISQGHFSEDQYRRLSTDEIPQRFKDPEFYQQQIEETRGESTDHTKKVIKLMSLFGGGLAIATGLLAKFALGVDDANTKSFSWQAKPGAVRRSDRACDTTVRSCRHAA